jgi:glycosyltransferase involved in cell wall biosynthesis
MQVKQPTEKIRVVHIITQLEMGGAQRNTLYTINHLDPKSYEKILLCGPGGMLDHEAKQDAAKSGWAIQKIPMLVRPIRPWKDVPALWDLYKHLVQLKPTIVHTHSSKAGIIGRLAARLAGVPIIIHTFHGFGFNQQQYPWTRWLFINLEKLCAKLSTHLIFVSEANRSEAAQMGISTGIPNSIIHSGIYVGKERRKQIAPIRQKLNIPPRSKAWVVVYVGNFKPQKNPWDLVKVAVEVLKRKPEIHFLLVGDGELREDIENWCKQQHRGSQMHFLGWCTRTQNYDVMDILKISDCFLLTSLWEGLPRSLVEASYAGLPSLAYAVDGVQDIIKNGENGFLIPPGDIRLAADKILQLASNPSEAKRMGQKALERIRSMGRDFDIAEMVREQEKLYKKLCNELPEAVCRYGSHER